MKNKLILFEIFDKHEKESRFTDILFSDNKSEKPQKANTLWGPRQKSEQEDMSNQEPKSDTVPISQPHCHNRRLLKI